MRFKQPNSAPRGVPIDMTPMIDIVFQLLIFFLVTSQMAESSRAQLNLPKEQGENETSTDSASFTINIQADGTVVINDNVVSLEALDVLVEEAIAQAGGAERLQPLVRVDRTCDAARLNEVLTRLGARGLLAIRLATERSQ